MKNPHTPILIFILLYCLVKLEMVNGENEIDINKCGRERICYRDPSNCKSEKDCLWIVSLKSDQNTKKTNIQMYVKNDYVIMGLSKDINEGDDSLFACEKTATSGKVTIYYLDKDKKFIVKNSGNGIMDTKFTNVNGFLRCSFVRNNTFNNSDIFDIEKNKHHLYYIFSFNGKLENGQLKKLTNASHTISKMNLVNIVNIIGNKVKASPMVKAHGCLMVLAWMFFAPIGIFTARYFQKTFDEEDEGAWYFIHWVCMASVFILTIIAFILIFVDSDGYVGPYYDSSPQKAHPILGLIVFALCLANPIVAAIRGALTPNKDDDNRVIFNWIHKLIGISVGVLSFINIMIGTWMPKAHVGGTVIWWILVNLLLHSINAVILDLIQCGEDKENSKDSGNTNEQELNPNVGKEKLPSDSKSGSENGDEPKTKEQQEAQRKNTRNSMYGAMVAISIGITIRVIVAISID